jgi:hypothetical protein
VPEPATENRQVAERLREASQLLADLESNPFRARAYRRAADSVENLPRALGEILEREGQDGLESLPDVGQSIAGAIREMLETGRWALLDRLRGQTSPERLFQTIPSVGPELARSLHETLHVESLEELEMAAHDGRILTVPGMGSRRAALLRVALDHRLGRRVRRRVAAPPRAPRVERLLEVDREYRAAASAGRLPTIAPRRFNPAGTAWLPILRTRLGGWRFTALFSNTARAHKLGRTRDWVVIYWEGEGRPPGQCTVVTERRGPLAGRRVVRGRERECRESWHRPWNSGAAA